MSTQEQYKKAYSLIRWGWGYDEREETPRRLQGLPLVVIAAAYMTHDLSEKRESWHKNRIARMLADKEISWNMAILPPSEHSKLLDGYSKRLRGLPTE